MKRFRHLFAAEIKRLQHAVDNDPENIDNKFMLQFMQEAADVDMNKLNRDLQRCVESWPCVKTVLVLMIWLLLRDNEKRSK
tara:strand:- start:1584 stop:1826 length:243 start_codon:yes stop_codon:yes gene_type:complete